jgi:uncharacterized glyoxalase superfamily protein PhnB
MAVRYQPDSFHTITPYLAITGAETLLAFLKEVFNGQEVEKLLWPDGTVNHAEVRIGDSIVMLGEPENAADAVTTTLYVYVPDTDKSYKAALKAGATSIREPADQYYGDRSAVMRDPTGNTW